MHFVKKNSEEKRKNLNDKLKSNKILRVPGAYNPLTAKVIEEIGYEAVYVSGGVMANDLGYPDIGLTTLKDVSYRSNQIARVTNLPTIVDVDTGFKSCEETIKTFEKFGIAAVHIEDQIEQKRCGHLDNKELIPKEEMIKKIKECVNSKKDVNISIIGKYVNLKDAYKSLDEALIHGGISNNLKVNLIRIDSENLKIKNLKSLLKNVSGIIIPGGFGKRGSEGKIAAIKYARLNNIPFLGICFGMQMAIIEAARNLLNIKNASTSEFGNNCTPVVGLLEEWQKGKKIFKGSEKNLGGTMRLGLYEAQLLNNSLIKNIYKSKSIKERHRHRYEVNINYKNQFEKKGLIFSGNSPDKNLPEIIELKNHPWFIGVQFHPEFKSRPLYPHPLFSSFIKAAKNHQK